MLIKPVEYGVDLGQGGIEVNLIAAPAEPAVVAAPRVEEVPVVKEIIPQPQVKPVEPPVAKVEKKGEVNTQPAVEKGDGSSARAGKSETTVSSTGGAVTRAKPDYLSNPAPSYPYEARRKKWEGTVIVRAWVSKTGQPLKLEIQRSSGHEVLDEAALKTVKKWSFHPAKLGDIPMESSVVIPIRFELESLRS